MAPVVGFIGTGNMGAAIIRGLSPLGKADLLGFDLNAAKLAELAAETGMAVAKSPLDVATGADYVVLCVKPQHMREVLDSLRPALAKGKCLVSIAAGITMEKLAAWSGGRCPVVRIMPNTPALVGAGSYAVCLDDPKLAQAQKDLVLELFSAIGKTFPLPEKDFDAFTALSGSGPAYVMYFMEALIESGVYVGLSRGLSTDVVLELLRGSVKMALESGQHVSLLREMVTSPAGTTIEALLHLDRSAVRAAVIEAVAMARDRSIELGR
ncbi:pyrroline-5-carboxylate reductase [Desulfovibrio sulfodismutans]|uniref:Pyrroline-5-carboxylate reductase n=1 Tax=Desulfolutivibrio sulfodismutans TaxID=63561 RepID=A0A7K3NGR5_9BACT|nr:pyrroline-5-carboxylate reductase [Desulfolutivibrio sulfodismutans]NDY55382.1 pyrroline-5-carboxylate reductase [Desulfolutivibrio sulfodismutans]QLA12242.1 pyrroline-5-carboxylate reductase [Desulfolutivibrio sulfodismutans DSM 3696]